MQRVDGAAPLRRRDRLIQQRGRRAREVRRLELRHLVALALGRGHEVEAHARIEGDSFSFTRQLSCAYHSVIRNLP